MANDVVSYDSGMAFTTRMSVTATGIGRALAEDVSDVIIMIDPTETPLLTMLKKKRASGKTHEWLSDALTAAENNNQNEGQVFATDTIAAKTRYANPCQISWNVAEVTGTMEAVTQYGVKSELAYQMVKKMKELKRDVDFALWSGNSGAGDTADNSAMGTEGFGPMMIAQSSAYTGANDFTVAQMSGDTAENEFNLVLQEIWDNGPSPNIAFCNGAVKRQISKWTGVATKNFDQTEKRLVNVIDYYESDFGVIRIVIDRYVPSPAVTDFPLISAGDFDKAGVAYLRPFQTKNIASVKDATAKAVLVEFANEYGHPGCYGYLKATDA